MAAIKVQPHRKAFTLIELLVVMAIILVIAGITYMLTPNMGQRKMVSAADQITAWLLNAKMQAKRDGRATGVRLYVDPNTPPPPSPAAFPGSQTFIQMVYVQQPETFAGVQFKSAGAALKNSLASCNTGTTTVNFGFNVNGTFQSSANILTGSAASAGQADIAPVEIGDYILFNSVGCVYQILTVPNGGSTVTVAGPSGPTLPSGGVTFQIIRQPRKLLGEEDLLMPDGTAIFLPNSTSSPAPPPGGCLNVPLRTVNGTPYLEIMFTPAGNVVSQGTGQDRIYLWLYDTAVNGADTPITGIPTTGQPPVIISIQVRTGLIGTFPVDATSGNPYSFAKTARSSGM